MKIKRPFAKKTAGMQEENAKNWAEDLQKIYDPLINCAKASREIKQLLKKYDAEKNESKQEKHIEDIIDVRKKMTGDYNKVVENMTECLGWADDVKSDREDTLIKLGLDENDSSVVDEV